MHSVLVTIAFNFVNCLPLDWCFCTAFNVKVFASLWFHHVQSLWNTDLVVYLRISFIFVNKMTRPSKLWLKHQSICVKFKEVSRNYLSK